MTNREDFILIGRDGEITTLDRDRFEAALGDMPERNRKRLEFMSQDHHRVRYFVVEEMPRIAVPLSAALIAERLDLPGERVKVILEELERNLFFLVRNPEGEVSWAFPVTTEPTPHHMTFSTGERLYGA